MHQRFLHITTSYSAVTTQTDEVVNSPSDSLPHQQTHLTGLLPSCCPQIDFWVWDSGSPVLNATVNRIVLIEAPCPDKSAPYLCYDSHAERSLCSGA